MHQPQSQHISFYPSKASRLPPCQIYCIFLLCLFEDPMNFTQTWLSRFCFPSLQCSHSYLLSLPLWSWSLAFIFSSHLFITLLFLTLYFLVLPDTHLKSFYCIYFNTSPHISYFHLNITKWEKASCFSGI